MWLQQRLKGLPGLLSSIWARRVLIGLLVFMIFYWYLGGDFGLRLFSSSAKSGGVAGQCLQNEIHRWKSLVERGEGIHSTPLEPMDTPFVSGNGHILVDIDSNKLWVASSPQAGSAPVHQTEYSPLVTISLPGKRAEARATMLWFRKGSVLSVRCLLPATLQSARDCLSVREEFIAHRSRPNVYLQRIHVKNPSERSATLELAMEPAPFNSKFSSTVEKLEDKEVLLSVGRVQAQKNRVVLVVVVTRNPSGRVQLEAKSEYPYSVLSVVWSSEPVEPSKVEETMARLKDGARKELAELLRADVEELVLDHQQAWLELFISGQLAEHSALISWSVSWSLCSTIYKREKLYSPQCVWM